MRGVWKRSYGRPTKAPPDERGGNRHGRPNTTAPHPDSTNSIVLSTVNGVRNGASSALCNRAVLDGSMPSASGAGGKRPVVPVAQGFAHDEVQGGALQPWQLLREQCHALPPRIRHPGTVGAPEPPPRPPDPHPATHITHPPPR